MVRFWKSVGRFRGLGAAVAVLAAVGLAGAAFGGSSVSGSSVSGSSHAAGAVQNSDAVENIVFAIHGGAGTLRREDFTPRLEARYRNNLRRAVQSGYEVLNAGGTSVEAVEAAITFLEDSELFNAGKGAVMTTDAGHELDASIMDGSNLDAGAVTGVKHIKNPISLARTLMENSRHVLLAGDGAELYAQHRDFDLVTQDYFFTERRWKSLLDAKAGSTDFNFGETETVGAVALDQTDNLAAGTSTGGLTNKPVGRIGDSPIIGAGTYANNDTVAVSATGTGELFIRQVASFRVSAGMEYAGLGVADAAQAAVDKVAEIGGPDSGGVIALDKDGNLAMPFNTSGMYRGYATADGQIVVAIFGDE
jgi:beta-aspartyl-peptidase (threonine type)